MNLKEYTGFQNKGGIVKTMSETNTGNNKFKAFLKKKDIEISFKRYFIDF